MRRTLSGGAMIAVAVGVMNLATYGFNIIAAHLLGPQPYGAVAALLNVLLVLTVMQLALQASAARRIAADPSHAHEVEATMRRVGWHAALGLGALCILLSPLINVGLRLHSLETAALVGVTIVPLTLMGAHIGVLQGERRWAPVALIYVVFGLSRLALGAAMMIWHPTELAAMIGVAGSAFAPIVVGELALRRIRQTRVDARSGEHSARSMWTEVFHNGQALLAFFALSNVDVIVARNVLSSHEAGLYAGGLILVKAGLFLPQFVVVLAFPSMGSESARREVLLRSLALVASIGVLTAVGAAVLSDLALTFVGGRQYAPIQHVLWAFAALGTLLSMLQLLVYSVLARQARRSVLLVWAALVVVIVGGQFVHTFTTLLTLVLVTDASLFVVLLAISLWRLQRPRSAQPAAEPVQSSG